MDLLGEEASSSLNVSHEISFAEKTDSFFAFLLCLVSAVAVDVFWRLMPLVRGKNLSEIF